MQLIIVESPTKAKTIQEFLGSDFKILSSYGHIRDLPKTKLGIDIENNFEPKYVIPSKAKKITKLLKKGARESDGVILATDEDREGEAIAWHLSKILELNNDHSYQRIVFHEITKSAIEKALQNPRKINMGLVDAQQARRVLDRIVGYKLSPFLWKKLVKGLSAGRVQSVTVKLIVDREREINDFKPQEFWKISAFFQKNQKEFESFLAKKDNKAISKLEIKTQDEANQIIKDLKKADYKVAEIERKEVKRNPLPPFTTSTLQQEGWKKFRMPAKFTMGIAQKLYEQGLITYHRTDSLNLSSSSLSLAKNMIVENYGKNYWPGFSRKYKVKRKAQEAHEAIRPSCPDKKPEKLKIKLDPNQFKIYDLIWRRFIACQMSQAIFDSTRVEIETGKYTFRSSGQILKFDGFLKIYSQKFKESELPVLEKDEILNLIKLSPDQHFTKPPPRYSEASLIKELEKNGIGRPSTYAPTIATIKARNYVEKNEQKKFEPTEIGIMVNDLLAKHFPKIVDIGFTAKMENDLDEIAQGKKEWNKVIQDFYKPFKKNLMDKEKEVDKKVLIEETDKKCPECNSPLVIRLGRFGKFYACSDFPKCKYTKPFPPPSIGIKCPKCKKGEIVERKTRKGKTFYGCNCFPKCKFAAWNKPNGELCPECKEPLVEMKSGQIKCSNKECNYTKNKD